MIEFKFALKALRQAEINKHAADVFNVDQVGAVFDVVADVDTANTNGAVKGREDRHARQSRIGQGQLSLCHLQTGPTLFEHPLGDKVLSDQLLIALVVGFGDRNLGHRLANFGLLKRIVELHQNLTFANLGTIAKTQRLNASGHLRAHHHALT